MITSTLYITRDIYLFNDERFIINTVKYTNILLSAHRYSAWIIWENALRHFVLSKYGSRIYIIVCNSFPSYNIEYYYNEMCNLTKIVPYLKPLCQVE